MRASVQIAAVLVVLGVAIASVPGVMAMPSGANLLPTAGQSPIREVRYYRYYDRDHYHPYYRRYRYGNYYRPYRNYYNRYDYPGRYYSRRRHYYRDYY
jgi:hypothetical protein